MYGGYVDNANIVGWNSSQAEGARDMLSAVFKEKGLCYRVEVDLDKKMECVGLVIDLETREVRNTARRIWRLHAGIQQLVRQQRCSGDAMR